MVCLATTRPAPLPMMTECGTTASLRWWWRSSSFRGTNDGLARPVDATMHSEGGGGGRVLWPVEQ